MLTNLAIATVIAILIVVVIGGPMGWILDLSNRRKQRLVDAYWKKFSLNCPACGAPYADLTPCYIICVNDGFSNLCPDRDFHCQRCGEIAGFKRTEGQPRFVWFESQSRHCQECGELFVGMPDSPCPTCNECNHVLMKSDIVKL